MTQKHSVYDKEYINRAITNYAKERCELMEMAKIKYDKFLFFIKPFYEKPRWEKPESYNKGKPVLKKY